MVDEDYPNIRVTRMPWPRNLPTVVITELSTGIKSSTDWTAQ